MHPRALAERPLRNWGVTLGLSDAFFHESATTALAPKRPSIEPERPFSLAIVLSELGSAYSSLSPPNLLYLAKMARTTPKDISSKIAGYKSPTTWVKKTRSRRDTSSSARVSVSVLDESEVVRKTKAMQRLVVLPAAAGQGCSHATLRLLCGPFTHTRPCTHSRCVTRTASTRPVPVPAPRY